MNQQLYEIGEFFMIRTPLYSNEFYDSLFSDDVLNNINSLLENNIIREAILVSSSSLDKALESLKKNNISKKNKQILDSLTKYLIRMCTRTTPYGLFSGVAIGYFDTHSNIKLEIKDNFRKNARPDMEWIYNLVMYLEKDSKIIEKVNIYKNSATCC